MLELYVWQESRICLQWTLTWLDVFDMCLCSSKRIHTLILYTVLFSLYAGLTQHHEFETLINMSKMATIWKHDEIPTSFDVKSRQL